MVCMFTGWVCMARSEGAAEESVSVVSANADLPLYSAYVWRGQVLNDEPVFQPAMNLSKGGFGFNAWGNYNLTDADTGESDFSEIDLTLSYGGKAGGVGYGFGLIEYLFPHQTQMVGDRTVASPGTREVYASLSLPDLIVIPTMSVYRDIDEVEGTYASAGLAFSQVLMQKLTMGWTASLGVADKAYNEYYFGVADAALNDMTVGTTLSWKLSENVTVIPGFSYAWLPDADIREGAGDLYKDDSRLTGYLNVNYVF